MAGANFQQPDKDQEYLAILEEIRQGRDSLARWLDGTTDSNVPDNAYRMNAGQGYRIEQRSAGSWVARTIKLGQLSSALESLTAGPINQVKKMGTVTISNDQWAWLGALSAAPIPETRQVNSGDGLSGGGALSANRTLAVDNSVVRTSREIGSGDGLSGGGSLTANRTLAVDSSVVRTSRQINGGDGLSGGGNLSNNRTLAVDSTVMRTNDNQSVSAVHNFQNGAQIDGEDIGPIETTAPLELGGDFDAGQEIICARRGDHVTVMGVGPLTHSSTSTARSAQFVVPPEFRPSEWTYTVVGVNSSTITRMTVKPDGEVSFNYYDSDLGSRNQVSTFSNPAITYILN